MSDKPNVCGFYQFSVRSVFHFVEIEWNPHIAVLKSDAYMLHSRISGIFGSAIRSYPFSTTKSRLMLCNDVRKHPWRNTRGTSAQKKLGKLSKKLPANVYSVKSNISHVQCDSLTDSRKKRKLIFSFTA